MPTEPNSSKAGTFKRALLGKRSRVSMLALATVVAMLVEAIRPGTAGKIVNFLSSIQGNEISVTP